MSNVISSQFFKTRKLRATKITGISSICFAVFIVLMAMGFSDEPITGADMFKALSETFIYLFITVFINNIISADMTTSSVKQMLGKGVDRTKYCLGTILVAGISTYIFTVIMQFAGFGMGTLIGNGVGNFDIKSAGFSLLGYLVIIFNFTALILFLYTFIKKSAGVIMIASFMPIISDVGSMLIGAMTHNEKLAHYSSYINLMTDVTVISPDSTQTVTAYAILIVMTIILTIAAIGIFRKEDIN